jgi:hypothetical protein
MCAGLFSLFFVASGSEFSFFFFCLAADFCLVPGVYAESWSPRTGLHRRIYIPNLFSCSASKPTRAGFFCVSIYSLSHLESAPASFSLGLGSVLSQLCLLCRFDSSSFVAWISRSGASQAVVSLPHDAVLCSVQISPPSFVHLWSVTAVSDFIFPVGC